MSSSSQPHDVATPAAAGPAPAASGSVGRSLRTPQFLLALVLLLASSVGLNGATEYLKLHFKKESVALRSPLENLPVKLGPWVQVSRDQPLAEDVQEVLGTKQYIFRDFVDSRKVKQAQIDEFKDQDISRRAVLLDRIRQRDATAVMNISVTYYTGMVDTVSHIPDRCYIADGYVPTSYDTPTWKLKRPDMPGETPLQARFINFQDSLGNQRAKVDKSVAYFFHCNGSYEADPLGVRTRLQDLFQRHGYYCKIELMTLVGNKEVSAAMMTDFLSNALPEVEKLLPDWKAVTAGGATTQVSAPVK